MRASDRYVCVTTRECVQCAWVHECKLLEITFSLNRICRQMAGVRCWPPSRQWPKDARKTLRETEYIYRERLSMGTSVTRIIICRTFAKFKFLWCGQTLKWQQLVIVCRLAGDDDDDDDDVNRWTIVFSSLGRCCKNIERCVWRTSNHFLFVFGTLGMVDICAFFVHNSCKLD